MSKFLYRKYVAIGDSLTEGLGDRDFEQNRYGKGWADRLAGLLAIEALREGEEFYYANLAVRGCTALQILTAQVEDAVRLKPDLVTILAGANDLFAGQETRANIETLLRGAISRLYEIGAQVVILDIVSPGHSALFRPFKHKADEMSALIRRVASEYGAPVINLNSRDEFSNLDYWCPDMAHFSEIGHSLIANDVAEELAIDSRLNVPELANKARRSVWEVVTWLVRDVVPFFKRRMLGQSSGDGLDPKHFEYECLVPALHLASVTELPYVSRLSA
jgi:lysophospholipase L1-like esterase